MAVKKRELYSSLWASCDELRGGMDASQYKDYVLTIIVCEVHRISDQRRRDVLPKNGIKFVEIDYTDFNHDKKHRIMRDKVKDLEVVRRKVESTMKGI